MSGADTQAWTIGRLLNWTKQFFADKGVDSPRLAAELLLAHTLGCRKIDLYARFDRAVGDEPRAAFRALVRAAADHTPVAYLLGEKEFFSLPLNVSPAVLIPRPETETLVDRVLRAIAQAGDEQTARVLDLCTGSGCVAVAIAAHSPEAEVVAVDLAADALAVASENVARHDLGGQITLRAGDLYEALEDGDGPFDHITANPPYVAEAELAALPLTVRAHEPTVALVAGPTGLEVIRRVVAGAPQHLVAGGTLWLEVGFDQAEAVIKIMDADGRFDVPVTHRDALGHRRVVSAARKE